MITLEEVNIRKAEYDKKRKIANAKQKKEVISRNLRTIKTYGEKRIAKSGKPYDVIVVEYWGKDGGEIIKSAPTFTDEGKMILDRVDGDVASYEVRMEKISGRWIWTRMIKYSD